MKSILIFVLIAIVFAVNAQDTGLVLHQPGMDKVMVEEGKKFRTVNDTTLLFDTYYPPGFDKKRELPVVVYVNGVGGLGVYRWKIYQDWGRLIAANGLIAVTYQARPAYAREDSENFLDYIGSHAKELSIDKERIGLSAASGNVGVGLPLAMQASRIGIKALVIYYGMAPVTSYRQDIEILIVRAGLDFYSLNTGIANFVKVAVTEDLHFEYINYPEGQHAFDIFDDTSRSREIILQTADFFKHTLSKDHSIPAKKVLTNSRLWNMIVVENKVDEALAEFKEAIPMYRKMPGQSPWYNHVMDDRNLTQVGYQLLQAGKMSEAMKVFNANQEQFPESALVYDALADGYEKTGDKAMAVSYAKKALEKLEKQPDLQPQLRDAIRKSSEDKITRLQ